jgi:hypothetical protein
MGKKIKAKKLQLNKETLRQLDSDKLGQVAGGGTTIIGYTCPLQYTQPPLCPPKKQRFTEVCE